MLPTPAADLVSPLFTLWLTLLLLYGANCLADYAAAATLNAAYTADLRRGARACAGAAVGLRVCGALVAWPCELALQALQAGAGGSSAKAGCR